MWLGLQAVSSLERCPLFRVSFIERFHWTSCTHVSRRLSLPTSRHHPFMHITPPFAAGQDSYLHITLLSMYVNASSVNFTISTIMHPSPHSHGMHSRLPFLYPQTQISVKLVTIAVQVAKLCCSESSKSLHRNGVNGAAHSGPNSRSKWHISASTDWLVAWGHRTLSGMGGKGVGLLQHGLTGLLQHRVTVTVST